MASVEAHERLIKRVVKAREANGMQNELTPGAFHVVSVDNLDISQSHAQVYITSSQRSWHGTSIQCTEPKPNGNKVTTPTTNGPVSNTSHESMAPLQNSCSTRSEGMEPLGQTPSMRTHCLTTSNSEGMEPLGQTHSMRTQCLSVDRHVKYYLKGCGCKTSNCAIKRCGCKKQDPPRTCGPGCTCSPEFC